MRAIQSTAAAVALSLAAAGSASASAIYHNLSGGTFSQDWTNTGLIATADDWSGVPSVVGYRGDDLTAAIGTDPQTILAFSGSPAGAVVDVNANQASPDTFTSGGVSEFEITNPVVAMQGSGTADAPFLLFHVNTAGMENVTISYNLRDVDGSADNSVQPFALQYRIGETGDFTNVASAFVADASAGPSTATLVTAVSATDPSWADASQLQLRVITTNAAGSDENVGVDDILIVGTTIVPEPVGLAAFGFAALAMLRRRRSH
jgi:hypothetical protein